MCASSIPNTLAPQSGYSYVVDTTGPGRTVYIAGQLGLDMENKLVGAPGDFRAQCTKAIENLKAALAGVGAELSRRGEDHQLSRPTCRHTSASTARCATSSSRCRDRPAPRSAISQLARPGALFEIEAIAVLPAANGGREAPPRRAAPSRSAKAKAKTAGRRKRK